jgi:hypothetical protein
MKIVTPLVALALLAGAAAAQTPPPGGGMSACREDAQKFCAGKMGPDRRSCMKDNRDKLSDSCKAAIAARMSGAPHQ